MFLPHVLVTACTCLCFVKSEQTTSAEYEDTTVAFEEADDEELVQQSVALIDIVFTDGKKRTCTGAIIHDYVVITAGHCFVGGMSKQAYVPPELTASFVVIGTKNKFEAGYEQYLPIERVITHPNMKGWKSDLALIHTFASMTANKIGAVVPLENGHYGPGDSNFTILSWGKIMGGDEESEVEETEKELSNSCAEDYPTNNNQEQSFETNNQYFGQSGGALDGDSTRPVPIKREGKVNPPMPKLQHQNNHPKPSPSHPSTKKVSRYLSSNEHKSKPVIEPAPVQPKHRYHKIHRNQTAQVKGNKDAKAMKPALFRELRGRYKDNPTDETRRTKDTKKTPLEVNKGELKKRAQNHKKNKNKSKAGWGNWRRQMGTKEANKLTMELFGFIGNQPCKKMVNKIIPQMHLNSSEIVCYASDDHYVTDEDSGAPAIRQGHLVAITVGGIVSEGDHIAVGIRLNEYCAWMSENLPAGSETSLNCGSHSHASENYSREEEEQPKDDKKPNLDKRTGRNRYLG